MRSLPRSSLMSSLLLAATLAFAQNAPATMSDAERARRDADKVFQRILLQSDKPRKVEADAGARAGASGSGFRGPTGGRRPGGDSVGATRQADRRPSLPTAREPVVEVRAESLPRRDAKAPLVEPGGTPESFAPASAVPASLAALHQPEPKFDIALMRTLRRGVVQVRFEVLPDGSVTQPQVVSSSHPRLQRAAIEAVAQWRFAPMPRAQSAVVDVGFDLD